MITKVLYVEDEADLGNVTQQYLELMDFEVTWFTAARPALSFFEKHSSDYQVVILDIQLPDMNGFDLAEQLLAVDPSVYLIFLTSRKEKEQRLQGLKIGAVDYITKPFDADELVLKVRNMVKHRGKLPVAVPAETKRSAEEISFGDMRLRKSRLTLSLSDNRTVSLTQREAELIEYFCRRPNEIIRREDILKDLWGDDSYFLGRSLDVFISRLRKLFRESDTVRIENVHGVGFVFTVDASSGKLM